MVIQALGPNVASVTFRGSNSTNVKAEKSAVPTLLEKEVKSVKKPSSIMRMVRNILFGSVVAGGMLTSCQKPDINPDPPVKPPETPKTVNATVINFLDSLGFPVNIKSAQIPKSTPILKSTPVSDKLALDSLAYIDPFGEETVGIKVLEDKGDTLKARYTSSDALGKSYGLMDIYKEGDNVLVAQRYRSKNRKFGDTQFVKSIFKKFTLGKTDGVPSVLENVSGLDSYVLTKGEGYSLWSQDIAVGTKKALKILALELK